MRADGWDLTEDVDDFLTRSGDFLRSRPALHTMHLTVTEKQRSLGQPAHDGTGLVFVGWSTPTRSRPPSTAARPAA